MAKNSITNSNVEGQKDIKYVYYDSNADCRKAILSGDADFTYSYTRVIQEVVYSDITHSFACVIDSDLSIDFRMAINLQDSAYLSSIISKSVDSITDADISVASEPYTYYDRKMTVYKVLYMIIQCWL